MNALKFDPEQPIAEKPVVRDDVLLVPWGRNKPKGYKRAAGVFDADGAYLNEAVCWRYEQEPATLEPDYELSEEPEVLAGCHLFGGLLYSHFGHFLCESLGRLWALETLDRKLDGIVYFPKPSLTWPVRLTRPSEPFFAALGLGGLTITAPQKPVRIEQIVIAEQGFGLNEMSAGRPEFRRFIRNNLGRDIAPDGPEKLYISRARLPVKRGSVLHEARLGELLQQQGYTAFHPQEHPVEVQIARYKAARFIVSLDASPLHLAAMVVDAGCRVAIVNRGPSQNIEDYLRQFRHFVGITPTRIDAVSDFWFPEGRRVVKRETHSLIDFAAVGQALAAAGFVTSSEGWQPLSAAEIEQDVARLQQRYDVALVRHEGL